MNEHDQQIAIAEALGIEITRFDEVVPSFKQDIPFVLFYGGKLHHTENLPDYLHDLNAMNCAERTLTDDQHINFRCVLLKLTQTKVEENEFNRGRCRCESARNFISATAAQRAEAFLRTIGKWKGQYV